MKKSNIIKKICQNPNCNKEFNVKDTKNGRNRKYCQQSCQIPWLKGKTGVYSQETLEKKKNIFYKMDTERKR